MAEALISGILSARQATPDRIICSDVRKARLQELRERFGIRTSASNHDVIRESDVILYAVKPQIIADVIRETAADLTIEKVVISIAAGVPLDAIESLVGKDLRIIRVMPNVCVSVGEGATAITAGAHCTAVDIDLAKAIFDSVGRCVVIKNHDLMDAVTGLSGSGPAYVFVILDALADAGVKMGLSRDEAQLLAAQTVLGAAKMFLETRYHPGQLKDMVTSPAGTTITGLHTLETGGVRAALIDAVESATLRSAELGKIVHNQFASK